MLIAGKLGRARINEVDVSRVVDASRTPIREALCWLAAEGWLEKRHNKGFFGVEFDYNDLADYRYSLVRSAFKLVAEGNLSTAEHCEWTDLATIESISNHSLVDICGRLEAFDRQVADLSGNASLRSEVIKVNQKLRQKTIQSLQLTVFKDAALNEVCRLALVTSGSRDGVNLVDAEEAMTARRISFKNACYVSQALPPSVTF